MRLTTPTGQPWPWTSANGQNPLEQKIKLDVRMIVCHGDAVLNRELHWTCDNHRAASIVPPTPTLRPIHTELLLERIALPSLGLSEEASSAWLNRVLGLIELQGWDAATEKARAADQNRRQWTRQVRLAIRRARIDQRDSLSLRLRASQEGPEQVDFELDSGDERPGTNSQSFRVPGTRCTLEIDATNCPGGSLFLVLQLLNCELASKRTANRFTRLIAHGGRRPYRFAPVFMAGQTQPELEREEPAS